MKNKILKQLDKAYEKQFILAAQLERVTTQIRTLELLLHDTGKGKKRIK